LIIILLAGCSFDPAKHVICETCPTGLKGFFDADHNEVVICSNASLSDSETATVLAHELVHAFDNCIGLPASKTFKNLGCQNFNNENTVTTALNNPINMYGKNESNIKIDWSSPLHVACTEVRAFNLTDCNSISSNFARLIVGGHSAMVDWQDPKRVCVRDKALTSVESVFKDTAEGSTNNLKTTGSLTKLINASSLVEQVFDHCYSDYRPFQRRYRGHN